MTDTNGVSCSLVSSSLSHVSSIDWEGSYFHFLGEKRSIRQMEDMVLTAKHLRNALSEAAESDIQKTLYPWQIHGKRCNTLQALGSKVTSCL